VKKVLVSVINNISTDQRIAKVCASLENNGYEISIIGTDLYGLPPLRRRYQTQRFPLFFQKGFLLFAEFNFKLFWKLLFQSDKDTILLSNDLDSLFPNYLISKIKKIPLVFDSHEIYSELPSVQERFSQKIWRKLEKFLIPKMKYFYTVSESYADFFEKKYKNRPIIVRNMPFLQKNDDFPLDFDLPKKSNKTQKILIYQGAVSAGRGIDKMIQAMQFIENAQLWIIGEGLEKTEYENLAKKLNLTQKIFFLGTILPEKLKKITPLADAGLCLEEDLGLSYRFALPNKLFDYIHSEIPVLGTNLPEIENLVKKYGIGETIDNHSLKNIAENTQKLLSNGKDFYKNCLKTAKNELNWEAEEPKLLSLFDSIVK
jgi:glycosyltransferase involved in cell wall biosynthesis